MRRDSQGPTLGSFPRAPAHGAQRPNLRAAGATAEPEATAALGPGAWPHPPKHVCQKSRRVERVGAGPPRRRHGVPSGPSAKDSLEERPGSNPSAPALSSPRGALPGRLRGPATQHHAAPGHRPPRARARGCAASGRRPGTTVRPRETARNQGTASTSSLDDGGRHLTDQDRQAHCREPSSQQAVGSAVKCAGLAAGVQTRIHQIYKKTNQRSHLFLCLLSPRQDEDRNGALPHPRDRVS